MVPIVVVGFARPILMGRLLKFLDQIQKTNIIISIDGLDSSANPNLSQKHNNTILECQKWSNQSKHNVRLITHKKNLGCNQHTISAIKYCAETYGYGLLLEDDCEVRQEYINFLNKYEELLTRENIHSICGWNLDWNLDLSAKPKNLKIRFNSSGLMGASLGMTFSRRSYKLFESSLQEKNFDVWDKLIKDHINSTSFNLLQKTILIDFWQKKVRSCVRTWDQNLSTYSIQNENGWDARWQLSAIFGKQEFLIPTWTVARENLFQDEGQWHPHEFKYPSWDKINEEIEFEIPKEEDLAQKIECKEITGLGISRFPILRYLKVKLQNYV